MKFTYHSLAILTLSTFLYFFFVVSDTLGTHHLAPLLLNIDFIPGFRHAGPFSAVIFHMVTTTAVYLAFQCIKHSHFYAIGLLISIVLFATLYPYLIALSVHPMFVFHWSDYFVWMIGHLCFLTLIALSLRLEIRK